MQCILKSGQRVIWGCFSHTRRHNFIFQQTHIYFWIQKSLFYLLSLIPKQATATRSTGFNRKPEQDHARIGGPSCWWTALSRSWAKEGNRGIHYKCKYREFMLPVEWALPPNQRREREQDLQWIMFLFLGTEWRATLKDSGNYKLTRTLRDLCGSAMVLRASPDMMELSVYWAWRSVEAFRKAAEHVQSEKDSSKCRTLWNSISNPAWYIRRKSQTKICLIKMTCASVALSL